MAKDGTGLRNGRQSWHRRAGRPVNIWLSLLLVAGLVHPALPEYRWVLIHLLTLGAVTNSIVVWSQRFTEQLLDQRCPDSARARQLRRIWVLNAGIALTMIGQLGKGAEGAFDPALTVAHSITVVGAAVVGLSLCSHALSLLQQARKARASMEHSLPLVPVSAYILAALFLPIGAIAGALLAVGMPSPWQERLLLAHTAVNVLGFLGFAAAASLTFLAPQLQGALGSGKIRDGRPGVGHATRRLWVVIILQGIGVLSIGAGALLDQRFVVLGGLVAYVAAWGILLSTYAPAVLQGIFSGNAPVFAGVAMVAAPLWLIGGLLWLAGQIAIGTPASQATLPTLALTVGFAAQLLLGVMSYLLPTTIGGPRPAVTAGLKALDWAGPFRTVLLNLGLAVWLLPISSWLKVAVSVLTLLPLALVVPLIRRAVKAQGAQLAAFARGRREKAAERPEVERADQPGEATAGVSEARQNPVGSTRRGGVAEVAAAIATIALVLASGAALGGSGGATNTATDSQVAPTGNTVRVEVSAKGMAFHPDSVTVEPGDKLELVLTNDDKQDHDLKLATGAETGRVSPGETRVLDAGVISADVEGWCTIAGHRMQGMTFMVHTSGDGDASQAAGGGARSENNAAGAGSVNAGEEVPDTPLDPRWMRDPELGPASANRTHRITIDVQQVQGTPHEGGATRGWWTFNGKPMGPTLRGKVGDTFEIVLKNSGTMNHSIDFHAGIVSPDEPMRDIAPGEQLIYRFTADNAGIWMYHCATMPMSLHVAAGMFGAVIIDPPDLDPVDKEFLLVQSEVYGLDSDSEQPVNEELLQAAQPSAVVFNGLENQYIQSPLRLEPGQRARFWLLNAGPNIAESFHIVGTQFPVMYKEGAYTVRNQPSGAGQALDLQPAQGGFVEAEFPEAGTYPFVNHRFVDAERGATGHVVVK
ncbi:multicopper oxidase domain-containing protein [uncultured Corynebacterium sp.]|uniref:multicopper oxidase domain-containing protein n=1 Tax=uncultured Corynebacterium sp. TaxID=159447 RepID=UPI002889C142|nr:multicopper oxidase domain-containing protein [uncultured Corynebacterium sp.]